MRFSVTSTIPKYDLNGAINKSLTQGVTLVHGRAVQNAPYQTGNLRKTLTPDFKALNKGVGIVGTNLVYARKVHFVNKKNPSRRLYLYKALKSSENQIKRIFNKNITNVLGNK